MTREELLKSLQECLATAPNTTPKTIRAALQETVAFLESPAPSDVPRGALAEVASQCAAELDEAASLRIGIMDSDSKVALVNAQRLAAMQSVSARLRELS